ncbi:MAG: MFS transporter [Myxococcota bacterium]|nr:MFS transporter [Myxococcota bacterium]
MSRFLVIWAGEVLSALGSGMTSFALGVWVYNQTGEVTAYSLIGLLALVPAILLSPIAGALVDKWNRKKILAFTNGGPAVTTLVAFLLHANGALEVWHIMIVAVINSVCGAFFWPTFSASTTLMVPKQQLSRASGLLQIGYAVAQVGAPASAGFLVGRFGLSPVLFVDFLTFLFGLFTIAITHIPQPKPVLEGPKHSGTHIWRDSLFGLSYILKRTGLLMLLLYFAAFNFSLSMVIVLITPFVLTFSSSEVLGQIMSAGGIGMLVGSVVMSLWKGAKNKVRLILLVGFLAGFPICLGAIWTTPLTLGACAFVLLATLPFITASSQVIWQTKVPPGLQGRVFAACSFVSLSAMPLAYLLTGPLADYFFEPAMSKGGAWVGALGDIFGSGPGRGMAVMLFGAGVLCILATVVSYLNPRLRHLEKEVPDTFDEEQHIKDASLDEPRLILGEQDSATGA